MHERGFWVLNGVTDAELVGGLQELIACGERTEARIVAHLAEVEARRVHLLGGRSLFRYCLETLGLSESQAFYRIQAAQLARRFPVIFELLAQRRLHLTSLALLRDYITVENHAELLQEVSGKTKLQLLQLLAGRVPRPDVPSRLRKLVPRSGEVSAGPTGSIEPLSLASYRLQLNTSEQLKQKLELAAKLMTHSNPSRDLAVVVERGVDLLLEKLEKERFGKTARPRRRRSAHSAGTVTASPPAADPMRTATGESAVPSCRSLQQRAHIPREVLRQLIERDGLGCSYVGHDGHRCGEQAFLQIHHEKAWAKGGCDDLHNLRLLCAAHNRLLAEREFGTAHVQRAIKRNRRGAPHAPREGSRTRDPA